MKKVTLMLAALALVLGISQCKKQGTPQQAGEKQYIELTADNGNNGSKVDVDFATIPSVMNLTWEEGDVITVSGGATGTLTLDRGVGTSQGHFSGEITTGSGDVVFTYKKAAQQNRGSDDPDFNNQDGTEEWIKANLVLQATSEYHDNGKYSLTMEMPYAVLKLNLSELVGTKNDVTISAGNSAVATVKNLTKANSEEVYMAVPEVGEHIYTFSGNDAFAKKPWTLEANTYYTADTEGAAIVIEPSALKRLFTVGVDAEGNPRKVYFSPGNLQYLGQAEEGHKWRFAEHQWDIMGAGPSATSKKGNVDLGADYEGKYNTGSGSEAARDLFGWGCTGYEDTRKESHTDWYQKNYQPYSTSKSTVNATYNKYGYGPDYVSSPYYNLTVENKSDWGCLTIGSDPAGTWRTLSGAEWAYLFNTRMVNDGKGEGKSYRRATINSDASDGSKVYGLLLYPDGYTAQTTATSYTKAEWSAMESAGVVFLPAAGIRDGTSLINVGSSGYYWSSSCYSSNHAYNMSFFSGGVNPQNYNYRYYGFSVRLVR